VCGGGGGGGGGSGADKRRRYTDSDALTSKDAYMFPLLASCVLFSMYMMFKLFPKEYVNMLMTAYFLVFGLIAVGTTLSPVVARVLPNGAGAVPWRRTVHFWWDDEATDFEMYRSDWIAAALAVAVGVWYATTKYWVAANVLGVCFATSGITYLALGSYKVAAILLTGLFFYDIFWVFGTDVMVTVARSFDAPIKVVFPRDLFADELQFTLLGLGDIILPGIFVALLLRFDGTRAGVIGDEAKATLPFTKTYFNTNMAAYVAGLVTTIVVMHVFDAAQPALLYLVPFCLGTSFVVAVARGELSELLAYSEEEEEEEEGADKKKDDGDGDGDGDSAKSGAAADADPAEAVAAADGDGSTGARRRVTAKK